MGETKVLSKDPILTHIGKLSSDEFEGRDSPSKGLDKAAEYIRDEAAKLGLAGANKGSFMQPFKVYGANPLEKYRASHAPRHDGMRKGIYGPRLFEFDIIHEDEYRKRQAPKKYYKWGSVSNVVGLFEGSDPKLKNEYVLVSAHYDHEGMMSYSKGKRDTVFNGADDNASGAAILLGLIPELARLKGEGRGPKRSIVFIWTAAEEKGLLGADYYRQNPLAPLDKTTAAINLDMVARLDGGQISVADKDNDGNSNFFHKTCEAYGLAAGFSRVDHNIDDYIDRQDGAVWVGAGIPTLFMFEGFTPDGRLNPDYHGVDDEVEAIIRDNEGLKVERAARMSLSLLLEAANRAVSP